MNTFYDQPNVTVIIPSYNRAHLLPKTIPTYAQQRVAQIILVDDASTDNTAEIVADLQKKFSIIKYVRHQTNQKQAAAKNTGIDLVGTDWVYFGDDDSVLMPGSIDALYETAISQKADIVGAKALFMNDRDSDPALCVSRHDILLPDNLQIVDLYTMTARFGYSTPTPVELPFVHASALVRSSYARNVKFDPAYRGNAFREETDFFVRCHLAGAKIMYDSRAVQVNFPRAQASGGAHAGGRLRWYRSAIENNWYFLKKNWPSLCARYPDLPSKYAMQWRFVLTMLRAGTYNLFRLITKSRYDDKCQ